MSTHNDQAPGENGNEKTGLLCEILVFVAPQVDTVNGEVIQTGGKLSERLIRESVERTLVQQEA